MKTIAYSEVPQTHSYVHLAYLSATSEGGAVALGASIMVALAYLLVFAVSSATKLTLKFPRFWRVTTIAVLTTTGCLVLFGLVFGHLLR